MAKASGGALAAQVTLGGGFGFMSVGKIIALVEISDCKELLPCVRLSKR